MIVIEKPSITEKNNRTFLSVDIKIDNSNYLLWYSTQKEYGKYFVDDRIDSFVVAFINYAMIYGHDIISEFPLSSRLYYQLTQYYIPTLHNMDARFNLISIKVPETFSLLTNKRRVGTGMSGGIDSLHTLYSHSNGRCQKEYEVDCLTFFNVGAALSANSDDFSYEEIIKYENKKLRRQTEEINELRFYRAKKIADEYNYPLIRVDSNIFEIQKIRYKYVNAQRNCSVVLSLQKLFRVYYYASTHTLNDFQVKAFDDPSYYENFALNMFSTDSTTFYSSGMAFSRVEKTKQITKYSPSFKYLNVCWRENSNCGKCKKCIRTLLTLDISGKLNEYSKVFNIEDYLEKRNLNLARMIFYSNRDVFYDEIKQYMKKTKYKYNKIAVLFYIVLLVIKNLLFKNKKEKDRI